MSPLAPALAAPCVLAFDTATERMAVALQAPHEAFAVDTEGGAAASATLLPEVQRLLARAGLAPAALGFIAFGCGPGAFTGLRTACAVAQGLGYGLNRPLLPIDSLLIVAEDARVQAQGGEGFSIGVAVDARMEEAYAAAYRWQGGAWEVLSPPGLYTPQALQTAWHGQALLALAGNAWTALAGRLRPPPGAVLWPQETGRAAALLRLAVRAAAAGQGLAAELALPLYLRDKVAQTTAERAAARALPAAGAAQGLSPAPATPGALP